MITIRAVGRSFRFVPLKWVIQVILFCMLFAASYEEVRREEFVVSYRQELERYLEAEDRERVVFPAGTWLMRVRCRLLCEGSARVSGVSPP